MLKHFMQVVVGSAFCLYLPARPALARGHEPLTLDDARRLVATLDPSPGFPLTVNAQVVARLNRLVADPGRATDVREALRRMEKLRPMLTSYLSKYKLPDELLAVPLVESGYENLTQSEWEERVGDADSVGAGLWMFIRPTARNFGLVVNTKIDERLDLQQETDAAMRLLSSDMLRFNNWLLALAAYNQGTTTVAEAIQSGGTRNPWKLVQKGLLNDYIAAVTAAAIVIKNPRLLD